MVRRNKKKAVSPLIATVLLIAFAVALGAVVMNWGRTYLSEDHGAAGSCSGVDLVMDSMGSNKEACYEKDGGFSVKLFVHNSGDKDLDGVRVNLLTEKDEIISNFVDKGLMPTDVKKAEFTYSGDKGAPVSLKVSPFIETEESEGEDPERKICSEKVVKLESLSEC
ncbi:MAG: archaellin/type IV pilin N-terminal domain-containing protein [Nanobdellota archaeon]